MSNYDELRRVGINVKDATCFANALDETKDIFGENPIITSSINPQIRAVQPAGMLTIDGQQHQKAALGLSSAGGHFVNSTEKVDNEKFTSDLNRVKNEFEPCRMRLFHSNTSNSP